MKRSVWKKHHKWVGVCFVFFMLMFCLSGIVLNHRALFAAYDVNRCWLPSDYHFKQWNGGLLKGSLKWQSGSCGKCVLIYGNSGVWLTSDGGRIFRDFNSGFPLGADFKNIKSLVVAPDSSLWAANQFGLYRYDILAQAWEGVGLELKDEDKISDLTFKGDTLLVVGRSYVYSSTDYRHFDVLQLKAAVGYDGKVSLFRMVWSAHNGEIFGSMGKWLMDGVAIILILLSFTGVLYWLLPKYIRKRKPSGKSVKTLVQGVKHTLNWHDNIGRYTFFVLLFVSFTGWCLRPPVLIALVSAKVPAIPGTVMAGENPWRDQLRMLRYDDAANDWMLSTSEGLYSLSSLKAAPVKIEKAPPVSVMGLNVWQKDEEGNWLMGSFSGMFKWNRKEDTATDYFTGEITEAVAGPPFGKFAVAGYTSDFTNEPLVIEYNRGTADLKMPTDFVCLPMSLWNLALEVHTGRIYTILGPGTLIFIFLAGLVAIWCLFSGYVIRRKKRIRQKSEFRMNITKNLCK